ncbi:MAG: hypothetical protein LBQ88_23420 [Treponema sp.]|jgi:hypothetical protein|nr:hypothetical protein [Treponema sp.]
MAEIYKTMNLWEKYHFIYYAGIFLPVVTFFVVAGIFDLIIVGLIIAIVLFFTAQFLLGRVICPNCKTPIGSSNALLSKHYKGFHFLVPKKCCECGCDLLSVTFSKDEINKNRRSIR